MASPMRYIFKKYAFSHHILVFPNYIVLDYFAACLKCAVTSKVIYV